MGGERAMSVVDPLLELAERCEAATGPSHELDLAIAKACYHGGFGGVNYDPALWVERYGGHSASLDAAMTLVPEGVRENRYYLAIEQVWHEATGWEARFDTPADECGHGDTILAKAATPALALCAAALKARATQSGEGQ